MALNFQTYPFDLTDVREWLAETLSIVGEEVAESFSEAELELIGPFPAYYLDAREFIRSGPEGARRTGWRALVQHNEEPVAMVEISLSTGGQPLYATRGKDPAKAFAQALHGVAETRADDALEVRWLALADIYVTALWLSGEVDRFIPTRLGSSERVQPREMRIEELRPVVAELVRLSTSRPRPGSFFEVLVNRFTAKSPRSGLPDE